MAKLNQDISKKKNSEKTDKVREGSSGQILSGSRLSHNKRVKKMSEKTCELNEKFDMYRQVCN